MRRVRIRRLRFKVQGYGLGFKISGLGFGVDGLGFKFWDFVFISPKLQSIAVPVMGVSSGGARCPPSTASEP